MTNHWRSRPIAPTSAASTYQNHRFIWLDVGTMNSCAPCNTVNVAKDRPFAQLAAKIQVSATTCVSHRRSSVSKLVLYLSYCYPTHKVFCRMCATRLGFTATSLIHLLPPTRLNLRRNASRHSRTSHGPSLASFNSIGFKARVRMSPSSCSSMKSAQRLSHAGPRWASCLNRLKSELSLRTVTVA